MTLKTIDGAHVILASGKTPPPTNETKRCKACSLTDLCEPAAFRRDRSAAYVDTIFSELEENSTNKNLSKSNALTGKKQ